MAQTCQLQRHGVAIIRHVRRRHCVHEVQHADQSHLRPQGDGVASEAVADVDVQPLHPALCALSRFAANQLIQLLSSCVQAHQQSPRRMWHGHGSNLVNCEVINGHGHEELEDLPSLEKSAARMEGIISARRPEGSVSCKAPPLKAGVCNLPQPAVVMQGRRQSSGS